MRTSILKAVLFVLALAFVCFFVAHEANADWDNHSPFRKREPMAVQEVIPPPPCAEVRKGEPCQSPEKPADKLQDLEEL